MVNSPKSLPWLLILLMLSQIGTSQIWKPMKAAMKSNAPNLESRETAPSHFNLFALNTVHLKSVLDKTSLNHGHTTDALILEIPSENGVLKKYKVQEATVFSPALQQKFPNIRSYTGRGISNPNARVRFSFSPFGFHGMITNTSQGTLYIDPYPQNKEQYMSYAHSSLQADQSTFRCFASEDLDRVGPKATRSPRLGFKNANDAKLRTFRLALACTGEYAQFHLTNQGISNTASETVKKQAVLSAMNVTMTRVNGVFERDLAITMQVVANNSDLIFLDASTDGLTNSDPEVLLEESQMVCDNIIGSANYDIGHTFSTGAGGIAILASPCTSDKARGVTGIANPIGDPFDINYVIHEMGHQFGANHTQNNDCNRGLTSVEPGSGSTIMGYAGICSPNVQTDSDAYFHAISIDEIWENISVGWSTCGTQSSTNNSSPTANAGTDYSIPISTPFVLRAMASDPDSDNLLTYCWEQMDNEHAPMPPQASSVQGPCFRSQIPTREADRYMPALETVIQGDTASEWEVVPEVSRVMNFRLTVRDNANIGSTVSDDTKITTVAEAGPFVVTQPNTGLIWQTNSTQMVTWDVAGTTGNGINAQEVDILLSWDGGFTYPITLASNIDNDGAHQIVVPNEPGEENRIMVRGSGHIFYDISDVNFEISTDTSLSINTLEDPSKLRLFPNPVASGGAVQVQSTVPYTAYTILDLRGSFVAKGTLTNNRFVPVGLRKGLYLLKLTTAQGNNSKWGRLIQK